MTMSAQVSGAMDNPGAGPSAHQRLAIVGIEKSYGKRKVIQGISLTVGAGEIVGLLGPNGAGKTVCFYAIVGLTPIDAGSVLLNGEDITAMTMDRRARRGLGYLPQEASIFRGMTVAQNIMAVLEATTEDGASAHENLEQLLAEFNIVHVRDTPAMALSGGERRRCEIAPAMAAGPAIMSLDEPFAGIDPLSIVDIKLMVRDLKHRDVGVLITDHNVHEMLELIDRVYVIHEGKVLFEGVPQAVLRDPEVRRLYLGENFLP
ncbi:MULTISPECIES: LPS export ABC transporter ATP-binding protein [Sphingobium]|jgi:lipopolysaccharide export system ATP-binding protein